MNREEFNDLVKDCLKDNIKTLYVSEVLLAEMKVVLNDKSLNQGIRAIGSNNTVLLDIKTFDCSIEDYLKSIAKQILDHKNFNFNKQNSAFNATFFSYKF